jgi:hypothetical protein
MTFIHKKNNNFVRDVTYFALFSINGLQRRQEMFRKC